MALAEHTKIGFYHSQNLREWTYAGGFVKEGLGVLECPDLFRITAEDDAVKWVLGASANGKGAGLPNTYAYWTGAFDGSAFTPDASEPQWLDHGWDWYGAVTFDRHRADGSVDPRTRYAMGRLNNRDYANITPTIDTDGSTGPIRSSVRSRCDGLPPARISSPHARSPRWTTGARHTNCPARSPGTNSPERECSCAARRTAHGTSTPGSTATTSS